MKNNEELNHIAQGDSVNSDEIKKFNAMADEWWDEKGKFAPLHKFNPCRIDFIVRSLKEQLNIADDTTNLQPLKGLDLLDVGCGGGLMSEPMTRLGGNVTGIDASEKNIKIASIHAERSGLSINYQCNSAEELLEQHPEKRFDIVLSLEIVEHVNNPEDFIRTCCKLLKPGGQLFVATISRTAKSFALAIVGAEYIMRWLPRGTHEWNKFLFPHEITSFIEKEGIHLLNVKGASYSIFKDKWSISNDTSVNYILHAKKEDNDTK
ncbi:MAG: bifunctional 2-polyprenyl-6-hydroxyphenol methylase/3-demethylubiquinol 3-O-methyltransferase UbiG [Rickettsiales bacterium]|nr:bifunctional 2-polyprenyl-6-hydroxyphenol methylase/3-demethylubiquinol 3-O-methyltransferase UbiG [Rickettsiales bacterium]